MANTENLKPCPACGKRAVRAEREQARALSVSRPVPRVRLVNRCGEARGGRGEALERSEHGKGAPEMKKPRVLLERWKHQYERMLRARNRLDASFRTSDDYDDAFYHAAQDAWHLKDWIKNDTSLRKTRRKKIAEKVHLLREIRIVADLANCTKHLVLSDIKEGAQLAGTHSTVEIGKPEFQRQISIRLKDGTQRLATEILDDAIRAWGTLLKRHRML